MSLLSFPLPDLRFEQSFLRTLGAYAGRKSPPSPSDVAGLSDRELALVNADLNAAEQHELEPLPPITPGIIAFAVIKDQIIMPLIQGFLWTGFLISVLPVLRLIVGHGQQVGKRLYDILGISRVPRR